MKKEKKERVLSEAEKRRLEHFEKISEELKQQGYTRHDLIIDMGKANVFAIVLLVPLFVIGYWLYYKVNQRFDINNYKMIFFLVAYLVLIVVHELIHGLCWSIFTPHHFKDIEFGPMKPSMNPYCTCLVPLKKGQHIFGTAIPLILLGIIPMIAGIVMGNHSLMFLGILMIDGAAGDILIIHKILSYKSQSQDTVYMDHPTEGGGVVFEKQTLG